jgi:ABC-type multidrug transport system ATPase subunit
MASDALLKLDGLTVRYGDLVAVNDLTFAVQPGEVVGLVGPNGAGKSSTLRVLTGQQRPFSGRITVAGFDIIRNWHRIKPLFGYVPDRENHFAEFTGWRNLQLFASLYGVPASRVDECLHALELADAACVPVHKYSLGMQRKLLLARALLHRPRLLYLDEPTANLDIYSVAVVHRVLRGVAAEGTCVLLTTHSMIEVNDLCDRVALLSQGRLAALESPKALQQEEGGLNASILRLTGALQP